MKWNMLNGSEMDRKAVGSMIEWVDLREKVTAQIEKTILWHVKNLKTIAKNVSRATGTPYGKSYETVQRLLFVETDTDSLIHAAKSSGAIEALFELTVELGLTLPGDIEDLKDWGHIVDPN